MKSGKILLVTLFSAAALLMSYRIGHAENEGEGKSVLKCGVVSIKNVFEKSKRNEKYRQQTQAEFKRLQAELDKMRADIEAGEAGLKTLKPESEEYMQQARELLTKRATAKAQKEFYESQLELTDQRWTEQLYQMVINATEEIAKEKGLDIVFAKEEPDFPLPSSNELMLTVRTNTVVYAGGCVDISADVMAKVDSAK